MKRTLIIAALLAACMAAGAQTGIYKHFAKHPGVRAYCVERYPMAVGDTICVTLLEASDSTSYKALRKELKSLPFTPRKDYNLYLPFTSSLEDSLRMTTHPSATGQKKSLEGFTVDGLEGDDGYYMIYCPSDRYVLLAFLCRGVGDLIKVGFHMLATEF